VGGQRRQCRARRRRCAAVARIRAGDDGAFELLVARYQAPLFRYLRGLVGDQELARDLLQETFLRVPLDRQPGHPGFCAAGSTGSRTTRPTGAALALADQLAAASFGQHAGAALIPERGAVEAALVEEALASRW
jgi:hypothetical protein